VAPTLQENADRVNQLKPPLLSLDPLVQDCGIFPMVGLLTAARVRPAKRSIPSLERCDGGPEPGVHDGRQVTGRHREARKRPRQARASIPRQTRTCPSAGRLSDLGDKLALYGNWLGAEVVKEVALNLSNGFYGSHIHCYVVMGS
jgi:hypothetical protein